MSKSVFCTATTAQAEKIIRNLQSAGFSGSDISVLLADKTGTRDFAVEHNTKAPEGATTGAGTGASWRHVGLAGRDRCLGDPGTWAIHCGRSYSRGIERRRRRWRDDRRSRGGPHRPRPTRIRGQALRRKGEGGKLPDFRPLRDQR